MDALANESQRSLAKGDRVVHVDRQSRYAIYHVRRVLHECVGDALGLHGARLYVHRGLFHVYRFAIESAGAGHGKDAPVVREAPSRECLHIDDGQSAGLYEPVCIRTRRVDEVAQRTAFGIIVIVVVIPLVGYAVGYGP